MENSTRLLGLVLLLVVGTAAAPIATALPPTPVPGDDPPEPTSPPSTPTATPSAPSTPTAPVNGTGTNGSVVNGSGVCSGVGGIGGQVCNGLVQTVGAVVDDVTDWVLTQFQDAAEGVVEMLVSRPVPLRNGNIALAGEPTNPPMTTVRAVWLNVGLPAALGVWILGMLLLQLTAFLPSGPTVEAKTKLSEGWIALFRILASWIWCSLVLHLSLGIAQTFAPAGEEIFASLQSVIGTAGGAGVAAILIYLSSGVLLALIAIVFGLSYVAPFILMPVYPVFIALSLPDIWIFEWIAEKGEFFRSLFAPAALMPVPTAIILGVGYPVVNALRGQLGWAAGLVIGSDVILVMVLTLWFTALTAPLFLFVGGRKMRPLQMFAAGALGAAAGRSLSRPNLNLGDSSGSESSGSAAGTSNAGAGRTVDPLNGSPFSRENDGAFGGRLGPADGPEVAGELGDGSSAVDGVSGPPAPPTSPSFGTSGNASASGSTSTSAGSASSSATTSSSASSGAWDRITSRPTQEYAESVPDGIGFEKATARMELDQEQYNAGYFKDDGEFKSVSQGDSNSGWLLDEGGLKELSEKRDGEPVVLYDESHETTYDARSVVQDGKYRQGRYERQHQDSMNAVRETQR